jgi:hypothetical protein
MGLSLLSKGLLGFLGVRSKEQGSIQTIAETRQRVARPLSLHSSLCLGFRGGPSPSVSRTQHSTSSCGCSHPKDPLVTKEQT